MTPVQQRKLALELTKRLRFRIERCARPEINSYLSFSGPLLQLVLAKIKTQTRRPLKPAGLSLQRAREVPCPFGHAGSYVGLLERWARDDWGNVVHAHGSSLRLRWNAGTYMPRASIRFALRLTRIGVERLQQITDVDASAEGFESKRAFLSAWDTLYGESEFAAGRDPIVRVLQFELVTLAESAESTCRSAHPDPKRAHAVRKGNA